MISVEIRTEKLVFGRSGYYIKGRGGEIKSVEIRAETGNFEEKKGWKVVVENMIVGYMQV